MKLSVASLCTYSPICFSCRFESTGRRADRECRASPRLEQFACKCFCLLADNFLSHPCLYAPKLATTCTGVACAQHKQRLKDMLGYESTSGKAAKQASKRSNERNSSSRQRSWTIQLRPNPVFKHVLCKLHHRTYFSTCKGYSTGTKRKGYASNPEPSFVRTNTHVSKDLRKAQTQST